MHIFFESRLGLQIARFRAGDFLGAVAALQFVEFMLRVILLRDCHFPVCFGGIALLFGNKIFLGERVVALKIQTAASLVRGGAIEVGLRRGDVRDEIFYALFLCDLLGGGCYGMNPP